MNNDQDREGALPPQTPPLGIQNEVSDLPDKVAAEPAAEEVKAIVKGQLGFFKSHPTGFWFFFWGEFAERCSFYGMRAILVLYLADQLRLGEANAGSYQSLFMAACYFLPLLGGYVADNYFGKYWTIVGFSLPYIVGQCLIGIEQPVFVIVALTLLAMGSGVIKPNISTLMGLTYDQQRPGQDRLRSDAFSMFYFAINVGAALATFAMPTLRDKYGYQTAFLFPAFLMAGAFIIFALGKKHYAVETPRGQHVKTPEERAEQWRVLRSISGLFLLVMFFWAVFDQSTSTWIFFANACMNLQMFGMRVPPDQIQAFNPVFILILLPIITLFFKYLQNRGITIRATDKMVAGFLLTALCMGVMCLAGALAGRADLRPSSVEGELKLVIPTAGSSKTVVQGKMDGGFKDIHKIVLRNETESGQPKTFYTITSSQDLIMKPDGEHALMITTDGPGSVKVQQHVEDKKVKEPPKTTLAEGPLQISLSGDKMATEKRWFVASQNQVTVWWQVFAYLIITVAEVLISVTGLELAYTAAPKSMTGFVTACWLVTVGLANLVINAPITRVYTIMQPMIYFAMLAGTLFAVGIAFIFVARRFNRLAEERAALPAGVGDTFRPSAAPPSDQITDRDRIASGDGLNPPAAPPSDQISDRERFES